MVAKAAPSSPPIRSLEALAASLDRTRLTRNAPLAPHTTFRIGGPADLLYDAASADDLANAVTAARAADIPVFVLGLGANILIGDRGVRGLVVRNRANALRLAPDGQLWSETGGIVSELIAHTVAQGFSGLEHYVGIPSTVGGALWQNLHFLAPAPARDRTMFIADIFRSCEVLGPDGTRRTIDRDGMQFGYDTSVLHHSHDIALHATFQLERGGTDTMHRIMQENLSWRGAKHPWLDYYPSAGSVFKKIEGVGAGRLIDQCGLKGLRRGDAEISVIHANIIVNLGHATARDVRDLIATVQEAVRARCHVDLEPEIGFIGEF
jgi:UDP-N-acetylmuramate dehydrogenase